MGESEDHKWLVGGRGVFSTKSGGQGLTFLLTPQSFDSTFICYLPPSDLSFFRRGGQQLRKQGRQGERYRERERHRQRQPMRSLALEKATQLRYSSSRHLARVDLLTTRE